MDIDYREFLPVSAAVDNITVTITEIVQKRIYDCSRCPWDEETCRYLPKYNDDTSQNLRFCEVRCTVSNMSDHDISFEKDGAQLLDSEAFSYRSGDLCYAMEYDKNYVLLGRIGSYTKRRGVFIFPELNDHVWVSKIIIPSEYHRYSFEFNIKPFADDTQNEIEAAKTLNRKESKKHRA